MQGSVEEWTLINATQELHTFHIHQTDFQVTEINGVPQPFLGHQDNVNLPIRDRDSPHPGKSKSSSTSAIRSSSGSLSTTATFWNMRMAA